MPEQADPGFVQSDAIRDHVFPLIDVELRNEEVRAASFLGTCFSIGARNFALTAAHVVAPAQHPMVAVVHPELSWRAIPVRQIETHPSEDLALLDIEPPAAGTTWKSIFGSDRIGAHASLPYAVWGYPADALTEVVEHGQMTMRPDLVYSAGHISRRLTGLDLPNIKSTALYELSGVAGAGCSGSPVLNRLPGRHWDLIGVYLGQRRRDDLDGTAVGYALRFEHVAAWAPDLLGRTLAEELDSHPVPEPLETPDTTASPEPD